MGREYPGPKRETLTPSFPATPSGTLSYCRQLPEGEWVCQRHWVKVLEHTVPGHVCEDVSARGIWRDERLSRWTEERRPPHQGASPTPPSGTSSPDPDTERLVLRPSAGTGPHPWACSSQTAHCDSSQLPQPLSASLFLCLLWVLLSADPGL